MTVSGWFFFAIISAVVLSLGAACVLIFEKIAAKIISAVVSVLIIIGIFTGMRWYFGNTATGQRAMVDQRSNFENGIERVIRVYTADGNIIAEYEGIIDIEGNDGGYVLFDFEGKRYTYYNCFVESIAEIGG